MKKSLTFMALTVFLALAVVAYAQPSGDAPAKRPRDAHQRGTVPLDRLKGHDARELMETLMMVRLSEQLQLSDEQTVLMMRRHREHKKQMSELGEKRKEALKKLKDVVRGEAGDAEIEQALSSLVAIDKETAEAKLAAFEKASDGLTPAQRAKLYVFVGEFEDQMRRLVGQVRERRSAMAAPGPRAEQRLKRDGNAYQQGFRGRFDGPAQRSPRAPRDGESRPRAPRNARQAPQQALPQEAEPAAEEPAE